MNKIDEKDLITNPDNFQERSHRKPKKSKVGKSSARHGYKFESEILKSLARLKIKYPDLYYDKFVDTNAFDWMKSLVRELMDIVEDLKAIPEVRKLKTANLNRLKDVFSTSLDLIVPRVPADIWVVYKGKPIFIECKSSKRRSGFNPLEPYIRPHQIEASRDMEKAGGSYLFFVCNRLTPRKHVMLVIKARNMRRLQKNLVRDDKRSIPWTLIPQYADRICPKQKYQVFDLEFLITHK